MDYSDVIQDDECNSIYSSSIQFLRHVKSLEGRQFLDFEYHSLFFGAIVLYHLRCLAEFRVVNFMTGFLEVFAVVFGGGNIRCRHHWEKMFFAIALFGSFFLVSIILANFSMHSVLFHEPIQVNTFEKLAKRNVPFYLSKELAAYKSEINGMLR